jgi:hypothetical protein
MKPMRVGITVLEAAGMLICEMVTDWWVDYTEKRVNIDGMVDDLDWL